MSWAAIASKDASRSSQAEILWEDKPRVAVVDANAIISGMSLFGIADRAVTIKEVLGEIRDKKSRNFLQSLPYELTVVDPSEDSVKSVTAFARKTGDLRSLSKPDISLLALAHDLECRVYGGTSLRSEPQKARVVPKIRTSAKSLPGWGTESDAWAEIDEIQGLGTDNGAVSKIAADVQDVSGAAAILSDEFEKGGGHSDAGESLAAPEDDEDDGGWEVAAKSKGARRHKVQKQARRVRHQEQGQMDWAEADNMEHCSDLSAMSESEDTKDAVEDANETSLGNFDSCIASVTADFAMQNVLLQMGLKLVTPDGRRIREINTWVLRCSACRTTTQEVNRLFCPQCGNATLDKVELTIGPDGEEQFGVRKKHNLRGTKYSLPKPKGGKNTKDPILREDVMMQKVNRRRDRKPQESGSSEGWMTEFGAAQAQQSVNPGIQKGLAPLLNGWKNNPNERVMRGSNRRRK